MRRRYVRSLQMLHRNKSLLSVLNAICQRRSLCYVLKLVCILSKARVGPLTLSLFGRQLGHEVESVSLGAWNGLDIVAPQPVRGWAPKTQLALEKLSFRLNSNDAG